MARAPLENLLIFVPATPDVAGLEPFVAELRRTLPDACLLVVAEAPGDADERVLDRLEAANPKLVTLRRPVPLGLASAHALAMLYAQRNGFDALIALVADDRESARIAAELVVGLADADVVVATSPGAPGPRAVIGAITKAALGVDAVQATSLCRAYRVEALARAELRSLPVSEAGFAVETYTALLRSGAEVVHTHVAHAFSRRARRPASRPPKLAAPLGSLAAFARGARRERGDDARHRDEDPVACRICGSTYQLEVHEERAEDGSQPEDVSPYSCASHSGRSHGAILSCLACGMVFMRPRLSPEALVREYSDVVDPVYLDNFPARLVTFKKTLARIAPYIGERARILEVGSYCGAFLKIAGEAGLDVVGIEPSAWAVEQCRKVTDARVIRGTLDDLPPELRPFDVIAAWDVVEHFADPAAELAKVNRALAMGGRFVFCTLMVDNWFPRIAGRRWPWFMDMHLFYFTRPTIEHLLRSTGFTLVESWSYLHITTPEYLLRKLGTLGMPGASSASRLVARTPWARAHLPVRLGDIQLFVASKVSEVPAEKRATLDERNATKAAPV